MKTIILGDIATNLQQQQQAATATTATTTAAAELDTINKVILKSKKIIALTGAGISCNAGIPDFRSTEGLYNMVKQKHPDCVVKGADLFDISLFREEKTMQVFCTFMESLYGYTIAAKPTKTHNFIKQLTDRKKLIHCYTQNIDGLERQLNLRTGIDQDSVWKNLDVVQLHGDLNKLNCTNCFQSFNWNDEFRSTYQEGTLPDCPQCTENFFSRMNNGKRMSSSTVGFLKPSIILYGENHPYAEKIAKGIMQDMNRNPNLLIIFGTSLKVHGVKNLVKNLAKKIHQKDGGLVIFINKDPVGTSSWDNVIDYHIQSDCDEWCDYLQSNHPDLFTDTTIMTPPTTPPKQRIIDLISSPLSEIGTTTTKNKFDIYSTEKAQGQGSYLTPEYSPSASPRKLKLTERTLNDISNITQSNPQPQPKEETSPVFSPMKKIQQSPSLKRVRSDLLIDTTQLRRSKRKLTSS